MYRNVLINHSWLYPCDLTPDHSCQHVDHHGHSRGPLDRCLQSATLSAGLHTAALQHCSRSPCVSWGSACWGLTGSCHWNCSSQCSVSAPVASLQHPSDSHNLGTVHHCFNTTLVNDSKLTKLSTDYSLSVHHNYWIHCLQISPTSQKQATGAYKSIVTLSSSTTSYLITTLTQCLCCGDDECLTFRSPQHSFWQESTYYALKNKSADLKVFISVFLH